MKQLFKKIISIVVIVGILFSPILPTQTTYAANALVQTKSQGNGYVNSFTVAFTSNITAGNLLVINVTAGVANTVSSVVDNNSNTWTLATTTANSQAGERKTFVYYVTNANAGATTITWTWGASEFADAGVIAREYSGIITSSPLDQKSSTDDGTGYVTTHPAGTTGTTAQANELVILGGGTSGSASPALVAGTGYGNGLEQKGSDAFTYAFMSDKTVSSTGTQTGNFTSTAFVRGQGFIVTFKETVAAGGAASTAQDIFFFD